MDLKVLIFGKKPQTIKDYEVAVRNYKLMMWVWVFVSVFMFFGVSQQQEEINNCWADLETYRLADSVIAGVPVENCHIESDQLICDDLLGSIT